MRVRMLLIPGLVARFVAQSVRLDGAPVPAGSRLVAVRQTQKIYFLQPGQR